MDTVDLFTAQWHHEHPEMDTDPIAIWGRLKRSAYLFEKALSQALVEFDLNMAEFEVLSALVRGGSPYEMRPTELTRSLIITPGAVTARLSALERRGFIVRRSHKVDGRVQLVVLSAEGLRRFEPAFERIAELCGEMLAAMTDVDHRELGSSLRGLLGVFVHEPVDLGAAES